MGKYVSIEYSQNLKSREKFEQLGFDAYGIPFHNMNATLHYSEIGHGVCLVSYNTPTAFCLYVDGVRHVYYIKSSVTTERQITRFFSELNIDLPPAKRKFPNEWLVID